MNIATGDCEATARRLFAYLDRALTEDLVVAIEAHLAGCGKCQAAVHAERRLVAAIRTPPPPDQDSAFRGRVLAALRGVTRRPGRPPTT